MLYTVECSYTDATTEHEWNEFYSVEKLVALISVTGFITSQRFKALTCASPTYLAIHTIQDEHVINSDEYKQKGGGNFARWQANISDWHRNLYEAHGIAPAVNTDQVLLLSAQPLQLDKVIPLAAPIHMQAIGLDQSPNYRVAYVLPRHQAEHIASVADVDLYEPITVQLQNSSNAQLNYEI
jgi:hypothetical protein